jgi:hypothetical protein
MDLNARVEVKDGVKVTTGEKPKLQVCVVGEDGDMILRIFEGRATLTVRNPEREQRAEVEITAHQAYALADVLVRVPCQDCEETA